MNFFQTIYKTLTYLFCIAINIVIGLIKNVGTKKYNLDLPVESKEKVNRVPQQQICKVKNCNLPIIFLIGEPGVYKTKIFNQLKSITNTQTIYEGESFNFVKFQAKFILVDTPPFILEGDIELREKTIQQFQDIFYGLQNQIFAFVIVQKFERTDIMKQKIMQSYKFINKFKQIIHLMISDFHLSENNDGDQCHLNKNLIQFTNDGKNQIMYYEYHQSNQKTENLKEILQNFISLASEKQRQNLDFSNTIFEILSEEQERLILQDTIINLRHVQLKKRD